jgi:glycine/D-amino acid oxidase-like deaminating enzyme
VGAGPGKAIAIVGAGLMGCLAAVAVARRGHHVVLIERSPRIISGASRNNEGKIHLGFTYGLDADGRTPEVMFRYGSRFERQFEQLVEASAGDAFLHRRGIYAMLADSLLPLPGAERHVARIEALHEAHLQAGRLSLSEQGPLVRRLAAAELGARFGPRVVAAFDVAEPSVDCDRLCALAEAALRGNPRIEVVTGVEATSIEGEGQPEVAALDGRSLGRFDIVINAAWDGMPSLERRSRRGILGSLCLRGKAGFHAVVERGPADVPVCFAWGSFGDVVPRPAGRAYLSWYPACRMGFTNELEAGPRWFDELSAGFDYMRAYRESRTAFAELLPGLSFAAEPEEIRAGAILAEAVSDIDDPHSGLHRRTGFGIAMHGNVLSVNTGKLTCAPGLALELADMF